MNVVLISLYLYDNYAMRLLLAYLRANNIPVYYIGFKRTKRKPTKTLKNAAELQDYHTEPTEEDIKVLLEQLQKLSPSLIGIGLQSVHFQTAKEITKAIKARLKAPVVWGGSHPTIDPESCIRYADIICIGEAYDALAELSQKIFQGESYNDIKNLWVRNKNRVFRNETRPILTDLDLLPFASFDGENKIYIDDGHLQQNNNLSFFANDLTDSPQKKLHHTMTAVGCPNRCSYCINSMDHDKFRRRSVPHVIKELVEIKQQNPNLEEVFFWDNVFTANKKWCLEFANTYKEKIGLPFFAYTNHLFVDMDVLIALRNAGWATAVMGIQTGNYNLRRQLYNIAGTNEQILEAARRLDSLKKIKAFSPSFRIYYDFIKNNPLETEKELEKTLDLVLNLPKDFILQAINICFFPNYPLTKECINKGYITKSDIEGSAKTSAVNWISTFNPRKKYNNFARIHEYYYILSSFAQFKIFPNFLIWKIAEKKLFYYNPYILYYICRTVRFLDMTLRHYSRSLTRNNKKLRTILYCLLRYGVLMNNKKLLTILYCLLKRDSVGLKRIIVESKILYSIRWYFGLPITRDIFICPSHECNANCPHCYEKFTHKKFQESLTTQQVKNVIDQFYQLGGSVVFFCSGEFLLRADALDLLKYAKSKNLYVIIVTNGLLLDEKKIDALKENGLDELIVSIDSAEASRHDELRGVKGCFEKAVNAIRIAKAKGIRTMIWTYITKTNFSELAGISRLGADLDPDGIFTFLPLLSGNLFSEFNENLTYEEREKLRDQFNKSIVELEFPSEESPCRGGGLYHICVMPSGDVTFCPPVPYSYGHIDSKPLKDCLRDMIKDHKRFSHCTGQCIVNFTEYRQNCNAEFLYK